MSLVRLFDTLALDSWRNPFSMFGTAVSADAWLASDTSAFANTYIESRDTAGAYVFSAALPPGVKKEEVTVEVDEGNVLVITGERSVRREARRRQVAPHRAQLRHVPRQVPPARGRRRRRRQGRHGRRRAHGHRAQGRGRRRRREAGRDGGGRRGRHLLIDPAPTTRAAALGHGRARRCTWTLAGERTVANHVM